MSMVLFCFLLHFLADFVFQTREMGRKKSSEFNYWLMHVAIQFLTFFVGLTWFMLPTYGWLSASVAAFAFSFLNATAHGVIDGTIWKLYGLTVKLRNRDKTVEELKANYKYWEDYMFYATIGLDQLLHFSTIIIILMVGL